jgi:sporulation protein YlmC with PRC-barrel domain
VSSSLSEELFMAHYATLRDHQFDADVDDIRGAKLYGEGGKELATIDDIVFEHSSGEIEYLVANEGHGRRVLLPVNEVRPAVANDRDFETALTKADMDRLPSFDEKSLQHDKEWKHYMQLHRQALEDREKASLREYDRKWEDDPVEHRSDNLAHTITPLEAPAPSNVASIDSKRDDYVPDLTPNRLAPVFTNTENTPDKLNMVPKVGHATGPAAGYVSAGLGPKWNGYQEMVRRDLHRLRGACESCERDEKVA